MESHEERFLMRILRDKFCESDGNGLSLSSSAMSDDEKRKALHLKDLVEAMKKLEKETRKCYSENLNEKFPSDGCFRG
ncbi:hypothetical protein NL676_027111 [Syzygium grande]|nr:hypothetical protein NL676_027111 [Syzygium grande]